jgi:uncharacterized protein YqfA (UPF0365 family)
MELSEKLLVINEARIETDLVNQAQYVYSVGSELMCNRIERDKRAEALKLCKASVDMEIRSNATSKPTETAIANQVMLDARVATAQAAFYEADAQVSLLEVLYKALEHKRASIEILARMQMTGLASSKTSIQG